jgi:uncharacterized membrane protein
MNEETKMTVASTFPGSILSSRHWLRWLGIVFALLGLLVAGYMSWAELTGQETVCPGATPTSFESGPGVVAVDCGFVQSSVYAKILGISVAFIGVGGYLAILGVWLLEDRISLLADYGPMLAFGMALFGFLFSLYLTYIELFILYAVCTWCLSSAVLMTLVFIVATARLVLYLRRPAKG